MEKKYNLIQLAWPIFFETLLKLSLGLVNVYMISKFSSQAVGAVGVANEIISIPLVLFSIVGTGTTVSINQYLGSRQKQKAIDVAKVAIIMNFILGIVLSTILVTFSEPLLQIMKLSPDRIPYGAIYLRIVGGGIFIQSLTSTMSGIFRSNGYTKLPMYISLISNAINVLGNYLVVYRPFNLPDFGVMGIAVTNVIAVTISAIVMILMLINILKIKLKISDFTHINKTIVRNILRIGLPSAGEFISYRGSQLMIAYIINIMMAMTVVSYDAVNTRIFTTNIMNFIWTIGTSIGQATLIMVGHQIGANKLKEAYHQGLKNLKYALVIDTLFAVFATIFSSTLLGIFTNDQEIIKIGSTLLFITIFLEPGRAFNLVIVNALRASGDVRYPVLIGIVSMWLISVPLSYLLGIYFNLGLVGVWIAFLIDEWFRGLILYFRWIKEKWVSKRLVA